MFAFPNTAKRFQYAPVRFFEREFGIEYTKFEYSRKLEIHTARINRSKDVAGYVVWIRRKDAFLIVPTLTSPEPYVYCEIPSWMEMGMPPERSFIVAKGRWTYKTRFKDGIPETFQILVVDYYKVTAPDLQTVKPDIKYKDFKGILFDALGNVSAEVQDLVSHSIISSPKALGRLGGLTLSMYNEGKGTSRYLLWHLRRFLPKEFLRQRISYHLPVSELGRTTVLDPFPWMYKSINADEELSQETLALMSRSPDLSVPDELLISLQSANSRPRSLRDPPAALTDVPVVVGNDLERKNDQFYDTSPEILKFVLATHLCPVTLSEGQRRASLEAIHKNIRDLTSQYRSFRLETTKGGILDLNIHGKPLSLQHLILAQGRSSVESEISSNSIDEALRIFRLNMDSTLFVWENAFHGGDVDFSQMTPEGREIMGYIYNEGPSSKQVIYAELKDRMSLAVFERSWKELDNRGAIYERDTDIFDIAPYVRDT